MKATVFVRLKGEVLDPQGDAVKRALDALAPTGRVQWFGRGRARRWMAPPVPGFPTILLLPAPLPSG